MSLSRVRVTDLQVDDRVELTEDVRDLTFAWPVPAGSRGRLMRLYRIQDGIEVWGVWLERPIGNKVLLGAPHTSLRRAVP